jgi:hypothetical protein
LQARQSRVWSIPAVRSRACQVRRVPNAQVGAERHPPADRGVRERCGDGTRCRVSRAPQTASSLLPFAGGPGEKTLNFL